MSDFCLELFVLWTQENIVIFVISLVLVVLLVCLPCVAAQLLSNILYRRYQTEKLQRLINEEEAHYQHIHTKSNNNVRTLSYKSHGTDETSVSNGGGNSEKIKFRRKSSSDSKNNNTNSSKISKSVDHKKTDSTQNVENKKAFTFIKNSKKSKSSPGFQHSASVSSKRNKKFTKKSKPRETSIAEKEKSPAKHTKSLPNKLMPAVVKQTLQGQKSLNQLNLDFYNMQKPKPLITSSNSMTSSTSAGGATSSDTDNMKVMTKLDQIREIKSEEKILDTQPTPNTIQTVRN